MAEPSPIDRAFFRDLGDGTSVFFPWGLAQRGYVLNDPQDRERASRAASSLISSTIAIGTWSAYQLQPLLESGSAGAAEILQSLAAPAAILLLAIGGYWQWATRFVERLTESSLRVTREERLREAAEFASPRKLALIGISIAALSAVLIWVQPHTDWLAGLGVALGLGILAWSRTLAHAAAQPTGAAQVGGSK